MAAYAARLRARTRAEPRADSDLRHSERVDVQARGCATAHVDGVCRQRQRGSADRQCRGPTRRPVGGWHRERAILGRHGADGVVPHCGGRIATAPLDAVRERPIVHTDERRHGGCGHHMLGLEVLLRAVATVPRHSPRGRRQQSGHDPDSAWTPLIVTPPYPEYYSGHQSLDRSSATVLIAYFGDSTPIETTSESLPGVTRHWSNSPPPRTTPIWRVSGEAFISGFRWTTHATSLARSRTTSSSTRPSRCMGRNTDKCRKVLGSSFAARRVSPKLSNQLRVSTQDCASVRDLWHAPTFATPTLQAQCTCFLTPDPKGDSRDYSRNRPRSPEHQISIKLATDELKPRSSSSDP